MRKTSLLLAALALSGLPVGAQAEALLLDRDRLVFDTVFGAAKRAFLATDAAGRPLTAIVVIPPGAFLPPHGEAGGLRLLTVVRGTLSWGDGDKVDRARERQFGPGSLLVVPAVGGQHWAAARDGEVMVQVVFVRDGALAPAVAEQSRNK